MILKGLQDHCIRGKFNKSNGLYLSGRGQLPEKEGLVCFRHNINENDQLYTPYCYQFIVNTLCCNMPGIKHLCRPG
jgi:hypothetical protein